MNRAVPKKAKVAFVCIATLVIVIGGGAWAYAAGPWHNPLQTHLDATHQAVEVSYRGKNGVKALALLERYATVETKHYSFGDMVVAINGATGNGPKYWTFYVNGKMSNVGAGTYVTKNEDTLMWRLQ